MQTRHMIYRTFMYTITKYTLNMHPNTILLNHTHTQIHSYTLLQTHRTHTPKWSNNIRGFGSSFNSQTNRTRIRRWMCKQSPWMMVFVVQKPHIAYSKSASAARGGDEGQGEEVVGGQWRSGTCTPNRTHNRAAHSFN